MSTYSTRFRFASTRKKILSQIHTQTHTLILNIHNYDKITHSLVD